MRELVTVDGLAQQGDLAAALGDELFDFVASHSKVFVVEQNRDAQLKTLLVNEAKVNASRLLSVLHYDGTPITARFIVEQISQHAAARTVVPLKRVGA
jgi:2-oxoglutarate ferredoxin oxidoreductase subunit alpha